jgi:hypothetical protein
VITTCPAPPWEGRNVSKKWIECPDEAARAVNDAGRSGVAGCAVRS